jgi:hypothetical protein
VDSPSVNPRFTTNDSTTQPMYKPSEEFYPLLFAKIQWKSTRNPLIFALGASTLPSSYLIDLVKRTSWANFLGFLD